MLKTSDYFPEGLFQREPTSLGWEDSVRSASEEAGSAPHFPAGQLASQDEMLDVLRNGTTDLTNAPPSTHSARMALSIVSAAGR